jgi:hypothetical protein
MQLWRAAYFGVYGRENIGASMADIFVSYAREDREWVARFTERLREVGGWDIWWDRTIRPGEEFDEAIQKALSEARMAIVVWSVRSADSRWVRAEASDAAHRDILVPLRIDDVVVPLEFRTLETANLSTWQGEADHHDFLEIVAVLRAGPAGRAARTARSASAFLPTRVAATLRRGQHPMRWWIAAVAAVVFFLTAMTLVSRRAAEGPATTTEEHPGQSTSVMPQLTYGTWTLHKAIDDDGKDWSNSVVKFHTQEPSANGLTLKGTFTWRLQNVLIGSEEFNGHYIAATRQLILEGQSVADAQHDYQRQLAVASYSAILSADERSLTDGRWGSTSSGPGVLGNWEARR